MPLASSATEVTLAPLLREMVTHDASDLHLRAGRTPRIRITGELRDLDFAPMDDDQTLNAILQVLPKASIDKYIRHHQEVDFAIVIDGVRFRASAFRTLGVPGLVCRLVPKNAQTLESLRLPETIAGFAAEHRGLVLVTGPTGSGKSTTLAALVDLINQQRAAHIITIEDPIEVLLENKRSTITQREVGVDTESFPTALRSAVRQDPDVILIGELRDAETAKAALSASETGHLVLSTMHTSDAQETINRFIDLFHASEHHHVRGALASNLKGVVAQRLLADAHGTRIPACEILINTERISRTIAEPDRGNNDSIRDMIAQDRTFGMRTFDQSLIAMVRTQTITYEVALAASTNPNDLRLELAHDQLDR